MQVSAKLRKASRVMAWLSIAGAVLYVAGDLLVFLAPEFCHHLGFIEVHHTGIEITPQIPLVFRAGALFADFIPGALIVWALIELFRLFRLYAAGLVFDTAALSCLNRVASLMFWYVLVSFLAQAPISFLLSWPGPAGNREISLTVTTHDFSVLFVAGVVLVIARVMAAAQQLADENAKFV
jgi:hypothetical protein